MQLDRVPPASRSAAGLKLPFQKMLQQDSKPVPKLPALALAHVLDLLGDMLDIRLIEAAGPQQCSVALHSKKSRS
jgi:hypothetical protein